MTTHRFAIVDDIFHGYTIVCKLPNYKTHVYCDRCDHFICTITDGNLTIEELYEEILEAHGYQNL